MPRVSSPTLIVLVILAALSSAFVPRPALPAPPEGPKTIILGFDGMDHALTTAFMQQGLLPNLERLAEQGSFQRLETVNPAHSNVAWACFNAGANPGKTGVGGFVQRYFFRDKEGRPTGNPLPRPVLGFKATIPADEFVAFPMAMHNPAGFAGLAALLGLLAVLLLVKFAFGAHIAVAAVLGLAAGAGGWFLAVDYADSLPPGGTLPYEGNDMQAPTFWSYLDGAGVRMTGVQIATTYPPDTEGPNTRLLSGLGVKDVSGSPNSWFVFTDNPWVMEDKTNTGGRIDRIYFDHADAAGREGLRARIELPGPKNWFEEARHSERIATLEAAAAAPDNTEQERLQAAEEKRTAESELRDFRNNRSETAVELSIDKDPDTRTLTFFVGPPPEDGQRDARPSFSLKAGEWSDFVPVTFPFSKRYAAHGVARFHLMRWDDEELRLFVPSINIDPFQPPEAPPIASPPDFSADLAHGIGQAFETQGWACQTNPIKDLDESELSIQSFLQDIESTMSRREQLLAFNLDHPQDWEVYYQVFSTPDRIGHMTFREFDPEHPRHDPDYAATVVQVWGREFPLKDALPEIYQEVDRIVGGVLERIEAGEFGDDCLLMLVADHGFTSFRRGVNLNNLLYELGYLKFKDDRPLDEVRKGRESDLLRFVDWPRSQAYSMGLGKVFINLQGREPTGIVTPEQYDEVVESIRRDLLAVTDGPDGPRVATAVYRRDEIFSGPWWKEGKKQRTLRGLAETIDHDGFADLFLGFAPTYRVSWGNTLGGLDAASVVDSVQHWSGDHVSVDPSHVPGVLFTNRRFREPAASSLVDIGPTVLARYGLDPAGMDMDGKVLPLQGLRP